MKTRGRIHSLSLYGALLLVAGGFSTGAQQLAILGPDYPRVFYFRAAESACNRRLYPAYEDWERNFDGLMGIMGKCLGEECLGREPRNPEFFSKFKRRHPEQVVLLHFNGNSRDPVYQRANYFPGHWIHRQAVTITKDVTAAAGETVIHVASTGKFRVNAGRYKTSNDDIALFGIKGGKHDWIHCEQVKLVSLDPEASTITVERGCYGTKPLAFRAGLSRAAAHAVEGPWGAKNHLLWFYNYSTHCPKDRNGKACSDILVDDLAKWFGKGGTLEAFDGLEFDVLFHVTRGDTNGDGEMDNGIVGGRNNYGIGVVEFGRKLRARMGELFIIQADGALGKGGVRSQRNWGLFNGIESEGWPNLGDWEIDDWSGGLNRHSFWRQNARKPVFNYINHKWIQGVPGKPGRTKQVKAPFSRHRLVFAAAQFVDAMLCYSAAPRAAQHTGYTYWQRNVEVPPDAVLTFHIGMGEKSPERSDGVWFKVFAAVLENGQAGTETKLFEKVSNEFAWLPQSISLAAYAGKTVRLKFVADCGPDEDATTDHASWGAVRITSPKGAAPLVSDTLPVAGMCLRDGAETPLNSATGARLTYNSALNVGGKALPAYFAHPPHRKQAAFNKFPIWDEFVCGADNVLGWLGAPDAPAVHLAMQTPDLLADTGHGQALARRIGGRVTASVEDQGVTIRGSDPKSKDLRFTIRNIPANGEDLYISITMRGNAMQGHPREMARFARITAAGGLINLLANDPMETGMCIRGRGEGPLDRATGAIALRRRAVTIGDRTLAAVFTHPPWRNDTGYTFWTQEADIPANTELRFSMGMAEKSPARSDGVWFRVYAASVTDAGVGSFSLLFEASSNKHAWLPQTVPLTTYAGKRTCLKFVADVGPKDDSTTDQAYWGDVRIVTRGASESEVTRSVEYMTWVNERSFTSGFYFRKVRTAHVNLSFAIESTEPVVIESVSAHAHPDTMFRVFQNGLVLANPARKPYTFDLQAISAGKQYRRIQATRHQDFSANNGNPVGRTVTLGERDALFLLQTK